MKKTDNHISQLFKYSNNPEDFWIFINCNEVTACNNEPTRKCLFIKTKYPDFHNIQNWDFTSKKEILISETNFSKFKPGDIFSFDGYQIKLADCKNITKVNNLILSNRQNFKFQSENLFFNNTPLENSIKNTSYFITEDLSNNQYYFPLISIAQYFYYKSNTFIKYYFNKMTQFERGFEHEEIDGIQILKFDNKIIKYEILSYLQVYLFTNEKEDTDTSVHGFYRLEKAINKFLVSQLNEQSVEPPFPLPFEFPIFTSVNAQKISNKKYLVYNITNIKPYKKGGYNLPINLLFKQNINVECIPVSDNRSGDKNETGDPLQSTIIKSDVNNPLPYASNDPVIDYLGSNSSLKGLEDKTKYLSTFNFNEIPCKQINKGTNKYNYLKAKIAIQKVNQKSTTLNNHDSETIEVHNDNSEEQESYAFLDELKNELFKKNLPSEFYFPSKKIINLITKFDIKILSIYTRNNEDKSYHMFHLIENSKTYIGLLKDENTISEGNESINVNLEHFLKYFIKTHKFKWSNISISKINDNQIKSNIEYINKKFNLIVLQPTIHRQIENETKKKKEFDIENIAKKLAEKIEKNI